jgi:hypothetical protein
MNEDQNIDKRTTDPSVLTGMFRDKDSVERAYASLQERGYTKEEIDVVMTDETRKKHFSGEVGATEIGTKAAEGLGTGAAVGGAVGAVIGIIAAIGTSIFIPGLGIVVAGPIAAGLAGAGAGGITGGIAGALIGAGIPEARAKLYEKGLQEGNVVMSVKPRNDDDAKFFEDNWRQNKAEEIHR